MMKFQETARRRGVMGALCGAALAALAAAGPALAAPVILTFDAANDPGTRPACAASDNQPTDRLCTFDTQAIGNDYGSTAQLTVRYEASGTNRSLSFFEVGGDGAAYSVAGASASTPAGFSDIVFTPAAGFEVAFLGFDQLEVFTAAEAATYRLRDPNGNLLFDFTTAVSTTRQAYSVANPTYFTGPLTFQFGQTRNVGVDNIRLDVRAITTAVPEPATWAMMIAGFGAIGGAMRRRGARPAVA